MPRLDRITDMPDINLDDRRGRDDAFEAFYARFAPSLWGYAARIGGDPALADDIVQEAFIRYLNNVRPEMPEGQRKAFIFKIASRLLADHFRRRKILPLEEAGKADWDGDPAPEPDALSPDLKRLFAALPPRDRKLLWLAYAEGYSHVEIAEICGLKAASVKVLLFRLRRAFAAVLRDNGYRLEELP
jgi:RNA polymerase sigma-70 factor (ECF subfamily)